jgi:hypothetical protein
MQRVGHGTSTWLALVLSTLVSMSGGPTIALAGFDGEVKQFLEAHCLDCHDADTSKGGLDLSKLQYDLADTQLRQRWVLIFDRIEKSEMPPDSTDLSAAERAGFSRKLGEALHVADLADVITRGRGPVRRLTRREYQENLRDLLRLPNLDVVDRLPEDRHLRGFSKVSRLLDMSRVQLAGYLDAAEAALLAAVAGGVKPMPAEKYRATGMDLFPSGSTFGGREAMFFAKQGRAVTFSSAELKKMSAEERRDPELELALFRSATWPYYGYPRGFKAKRDGLYRVRFAARAVRQLPGYRLLPAYDPLPMSFRARQPSGPDVSGDVRETGGWIDLQPENQVFETTLLLKQGETFEYSLLGLPVPFIRTDGGFFYDYPPMPPEGHRGAAIQWLEVVGPLNPESWPPPSHRVLFGNQALRAAGKGRRLGVELISEDAKADAERLFRRFARNAARRPLEVGAEDLFLKLIFAELDGGTSLAEALLKGYQAFLCSGQFLYLTEVRNGDEFALASRLSHLLWNSRPDAALLDHAGSGKLAKSTALESETERLIEDSRFDRFVSNFTDQWLELRELRRDVPDIRLYPEYRKDDYLVASMERETRAFFRAMVRENLPVTALVESDFTFVNDRLAAHYGLPRQPGSAMRRVALPKWNPHGGLLTHASVLKLTANGTTTSPVLRGAWVMDKLLGDPPPPPPKSVPAIEPDIRGAVTVRQLLAKHTKDESCAACHARFDPVGFALENFDIMGAWRDHYRGLGRGEKISGFDRAGHPFEYRIGPRVDAAGTLRGGGRFTDVFELKALLSAKPRALARNFLQQLLLYGTGTPMRFSDRREIERILDQVRAEGYRVRDLLHGIVASQMFSGLKPE